MSRDYLKLPQDTRDNLDFLRDQIMRIGSQSIETEADAAICAWCGRAAHPKPVEGCGWCTVERTGVKSYQSQMALLAIEHLARSIRNRKGEP